MNFLNGQASFISSPTQFPPLPLTYVEVHPNVESIY